MIKFFRKDGKHPVLEKRTSSGFQLMNGEKAVVQLI